MSLRTLTLRNVCLSSAAAFAILSAPAFAVPTIIGDGVAVPLDRGQVQPAGKTTQIRFDDGSVISFVGAASYVITGEREIKIESGNVTVLGRSLPLTIRAGGTTIRVMGGAALTLSPTLVESHVFSGTTRVSSGSATKSYSAGQAWRVQGGSLSRILAVGPQAVTPVANLRQAGISGAALNGLPVVLGEALAALGASSDIIAAGRSFDAVQQGVFDVSAQALPSDLNLLLGFQADLAARLGGGSAFRGGSPVIIDTYLRYLAGGGRIAEFQTAYTALITTYLELLASGGSPGDFSGLGGLDIQAYLDYLQSVDGLGRLGDAQQSLVAEYLAFIRAGGDPSLFIASNVQLTPDVIALYQSILGDFVAFVRGGGVAADFGGADPELIARYIRLLSSAGQLDILFGAQADVLQAYADFLVAGGTPGGFDRFDEFGLSEALILDYTTTLQNYLTFLFNGGSVGGFDIDAATLAQYIVELDQADALGGDLADRRAVLLEFAAFVRAGNPANDFFGFFAAGLSDAAIAQYSTSISGLLSVYAMGGSFADYTGDLANILRIIQILEAAGQLDDEFATQRTVLLQFVSFINGGGTAADFDGFIALGFDAATVASYVASINTILSFVFDGGDLANFDGDVNAIITLINALETSGQLQGALSAQRTVLLDFVTFIEGGGAVANYEGFLALGLSDTVVQTYSTAISDFLQFLIDGGEIADFSGDLSLILSYINDLQSAGRLSGEFSGATLDALLAYSAFIADGGAPADFTGFEGLTDTGGGGNPDTGEGYSAGPNVEIVAGIDADALADFNFRGSRGFGLFEYSAGTENSRLSPIGFDFPVRSADSRDDNGFQRGLNYDTSALELVTAQVNGDILMARHVGPGNYRFGGNVAAAAEGHFVDSVYVAGAPMTLPTTGQVIYDLDETLGVQVNGDYEGDISLDMVLGLSFGAIPRVAFNGIMTADTDYQFSTGDDAAAGIDFSTTTNSLDGTRFYVGGDFTSGEGAFCSAGARCSAFIQGILNSDFTQIGGAFTTSSSDQDDLTTAAIVSFLARDASSAEVVIPDLVGNGTVTATPNLEFDRGILIRANGGSDNRRAYQYSVDPRASLEFDADGALSVMFRGFSNAIERGDGVVADLAGNEDWQVGRWLGLIGPDVFGQNSGYGYAVIPILASTPANGRIEYSLLGASSPVYGNGATAPGTFDGSAVLVIGTENLFGLDAVVTMPDATYTFGSEGGVDDPSVRLFFSQEALRGSAYGLAVDIEGTGAACPEGASNCTAQMAVGVGGEDGQYAGVSYYIGVPNAAAFTPNLTGTAVFGGELVPDVADPLPEGTERTDQFVVYSSNEIGIDNRNPTTVIYDDVTGAPLYYQWQLNDYTRENERPQIGTAQQHESGSVEGVMGWTRWAGGTSGGRYYNAQTVNLPENAGWHILSGSPVTNMPTTGTVTYSLIGNTNPTIRNGTTAPGTLDSASAAVAFGTVARVGMELGLTVGGEGYSISTIGGVSDPSQGLGIGMDAGEFFGSFGGSGLQGTLNASGGSLCSGDTAGCNASIRGFLAGDGASHMGITYTLGNTGFDNQIDGTAAFAAGDAVDEGSGASGPEGAERSGQVTAYAATTIGIDSRSPTTVTYDNTTGAPLAYSSGENESPQIGTAMQRESGSAGDVIGWTRWAGGRTAGRYYSNTEGVDLPENAGWHLVSGTAATNLPASGTVQYDLIGSTAPTIRDGSASPGTVDSARAAVSFDSVPRVGLGMDMTVDGEAYNLTTIGGVSDLSEGLLIRTNVDPNVVQFFGNGGSVIASGGSVCDGNRPACGADVRGFLAGDGASHLGISYSFGAASRFIQGAAAFAADTAAAAQSVGYNPDYHLTNTVTPATPSSVGTPDPVVPPVIDSTWTRWTQPSGGLLARPTAEPDRIGGPLTPQGSDALMPSWISYDRR